MSNYRVRQVMQLTRPRRKGKRWKPLHKDVLVGLATYMHDDSLSVKVTNERLSEASGRDKWAVNLGKRELARDGVISYVAAKGKGQVTTYRILIDLPALQGVDSESTPSPDAKGWTPGQLRGGPTAVKGVDLQSADQAERENSLFSLAKALNAPAHANGSEKVMPKPPRNPGEAHRERRNAIIDAWQEGRITAEEKRAALAALGPQPKDNAPVRDRA